MTDLRDFKHISERESDGSWEDCTWDSGLEWYRLCFDASVPATHAEAQALRHASGEPATGGSNLGDFTNGVRRRYGKVIPALKSGLANLKVDLTRNKAATVQGTMAAFPSTHRLSKWQRGFDGGHSVLLINDDGVLLWCDPLAPPGEPSVPVVVTWTEIAPYITSFKGQYVVAPIKNPDTIIAGASTVDLRTYLPGYTAIVKPESNVRLAPRIAGAKVHTAPAGGLPVIVIGTVVGDVDPGNQSNVWYALWHDSRVEYTAKDNVVDLKAPVVAPVVVPDGYTKATQEAAVAAAKAEGAASGAAAEKSRLRQFLGL